MSLPPGEARQSHTLISFDVARALIKESARRTNLGGRPRAAETPEEALGFMGGQG